MQQPTFVLLIVFIFTPSTTTSYFSRLRNHFLGKDNPKTWTQSEIAGQDFQVVYLPALVPREAQGSDDSIHDDAVGVDYSFHALGRKFDLKLVPNRKLISPQFKVFIRDNEELVAKDDLLETHSGCHYLHRGDNSVAAISACHEKTVHGLILLNNTTFELSPLSNDDIHYRRYDSPNGVEQVPHIIRKAPLLPDLSGDFISLQNAGDILQRRRSVRTGRMARGDITLELAVFLDEAAYSLFYDHLNGDEKSLRDMMLAYINGVQALYHHPSLGRSIDISLVRLELMKKQPTSMPSYGGERSLLLDSFCEFQSRLNVEEDSHPDHWDMAVLISGLDFYAIENGKKRGVTMGLSPVGGVCLQPHACVISEFGVKNEHGSPYPSAGFTSVYILAHEIGHNLGMHHDGTGNHCAKDGFIMSPSRGTRGETIWSPCSAEVVADLEWAKCLHDKHPIVKAELAHAIHSDQPGVLWDTKKQCEIFLRDHDAVSTNDNPAEVCRELHCRTPHQFGEFYAGPALQGTACGEGKRCEGGECSIHKDQAQKPAVTKPDLSKYGWSSWKDGHCQSGCTTASRGFKERSRKCSAPLGLDQTSVCHGTSFDVVLCDDSKVCAKKTRETRTSWASRRCAEFSKLLPLLDSRGYGLQAPHDQGRLWMGCALFCRRANSGGYYTPRIELNNLGADPYFPDGTWCHHDGEQDFYCMQHHCLPENFKLTSLYNVWELPSNDIRFSSNAKVRSEPERRDIEDPIMRYLSLDERGLPLLRNLPDLDSSRIDDEEDWEVKDYFEIGKSS